MQNHKNLIVWQKADDFAFFIYKLTEKFPKSEIFGLTSQLRRASLSVPTNIVEGYARGGKEDFSRFLNISMASLSEAQYLLGFADLQLRFYHQFHIPDPSNNQGLLP